MHPRRRVLSSYVTFDVLYVDGTKSSNRRIPFTELGGLDGDAPARAIIEAQDREIALASGHPRADIRSVTRTPSKPVSRD